MMYAKFHSKFEDLETILILPVAYFDSKIGYVQVGANPNLIPLSSNAIRKMYGDFLGYISEYALPLEIERLKKWESENRKLIIR